jgi:hypothetical protein
MSHLNCIDSLENQRQRKEEERKRERSLAKLKDWKIITEIYSWFV